MEVLRRRSIRWGDTETQLLCQVVGETPVNLNVEALKQAARRYTRYTRKFKEWTKGGKGDLEGCCSKSPGFQPLIAAEGENQESQDLCFEEEQVEDVLKFAIKEEIKVEPSEGF